VACDSQEKKSDSINREIDEMIHLPPNSNNIILNIWTNLITACSYVFHMHILETNILVSRCKKKNILVSHHKIQ